MIRTVLAIIGGIAVALGVAIGGYYLFVVVMLALFWHGG